MKRVYLIRHAETPPRPGRPSDGDAISITPAGTSEACRKGQVLKKLGVTGIVASPLTRARETAAELAKTSGLSVAVDGRAREFVAADVGPPDFKLLREKARREREWVGEGGESFNASVARLIQLLDSVPEHTCIVTHELLLQNFLMSGGAEKASHIEHLSILTIEKTAEGWRLVSIAPGRNVWQKILHKLFW